ncbi:hypothetical protein BDD12DRAFT_508656 [Trichophaea hybrida]|nr:hypothetical protein BDD12DRAFT_508656 [Trichophaea hybrida]
MSDHEDQLPEAVRPGLTPALEEAEEQPHQEQLGSEQQTDEQPASVIDDEHTYEDESDLSDLDEEAFVNFNEHDIVGGDEVIPIDEDTIVALGKHKKAGGRTQVGDAPKVPNRRRRDKTRDEDEDIEQPVEIELTEEEKRRRELDKKMDDALKGPKKKKRRKNDHDLERMDDETVENLRLKMLEAAKCDTEAIDNGQPATHKLAMVDEVRDTLNRQNLLSVAVDCGILKGIRRWLEPLPNKALPAYNVQKLMFEILGKLRPDIIHLRESGIGKIVMFYTKDIRPERNIKREAEKLVRDWSRPILGRSDDYRSRDVPVADGRPLARIRKPSADETNNPLAPPVKNTGRARVLMPSSQSYEVAPLPQAKTRNGPIRPINARGDDFIRKMKAKKAKKAPAKTIG